MEVIVSFIGDSYAIDWSIGCFGFEFYGEGGSGATELELMLFS
jgi:hypothetical protein